MSVVRENSSARLPAGSTARQQRAERILDVTAELLELHGYRRVTIDDVAGRAGVGKGTVYLHWKTREALFWAVLQREALRLFDQLLVELGKDDELALPHRLMYLIFLEVTRRPLVNALLLSDPVVLGNLAGDDSVRSAQQELAENTNYLQLVAEQGILRADRTVKQAGHILVNVTRGFLDDPRSSDEDALPVEERARLLSEVLRRSLEVDTVPAAALAPLNSKVVAMFTEMADAHREQLQRSY